MPTSKNTCCRRAITRTRSRSSPARRPWSTAWPTTAAASATRASATRRPKSAPCRWPRTASDELVEPTFENALDGTYPLGRTLYIYVAKKPGEPLPPVVKEFLKFVLSREGQEIVVKDGYGPSARQRARKSNAEADRRAECRVRDSAKPRFDE